MNQTTKKYNKKKKYEKLFQEYVKASFDASVSVSVTKQNQWINISVALWNGKAFTVNDQKAMSVQLKRENAKELVTNLQQALNIQEREWTRQKEEENQKTAEVLSVPDDW